MFDRESHCSTNVFDKRRMCCLGDDRCGRLLRHQTSQLSECPRQMVTDRSCWALKLAHDPAVELRLLEVAADGLPVERAVAGGKMVVEAPVMIVGVDV